MKGIIQKREFEELKKRTHAYPWGSFAKKTWSDWGLLFRFLIIICKLLAQNNRKEPRIKRQPSAWSLFVGEQLRAGKTIREAAELWKDKKLS